MASVRDGKSSLYCEGVYTVLVKDRGTKETREQVDRYELTVIYTFRLPPQYLSPASSSIISPVPYRSLNLTHKQATSP